MSHWFHGAGSQVIDTFVMNDYFRMMFSYVSKEIMGKFWFEVMCPSFGEDNIQLLYTGNAIFHPA